jgi:FAD/FMN-containing dehydrogenase
MERQAQIAHAAVPAEQPIRPLPPAAVQRLKQGLQGTLVLPGEPAYDGGRRLFNPKFNKFPAGIVYAAIDADVVLALNVARDNGLHVAIRSGGHCTTGWSASDGLLIDMSGINYAVVDATGVSAGAGCNFGRLNEALGPTRHVPGGTCPDVCVGGYMQGGGYGFTARVYGMNCDVVEAFRMVLADGSTVTASPTQNTDLYWAVRGGMGGNYGILLSARYRTVALDAVSAFSIGWRFDTPGAMKNAAGALELMQRDLIRDPALDKLGFQLAVCWQGDSIDTAVPYVELKAMYVGSADEASKVQQRIAKFPGAEPQFLVRGPYAQMNLKLMTEPHDIPPLPINAVPNESKEARYIAKPVPLSAWNNLLEHFLATPSRVTLYGVEMYGAQVARAPAQPDAFAHRAADLDIFCDVFWYREEDQEPMELHLERWVDLVRPYWNGCVYPNYPSRTIDDYRSAYWGKNFAGVLGVKQKYDRNNYFVFSQSVSPYPEPAAVPPGEDHPALSQPIVREATGWTPSA